MWDGFLGVAVRRERKENAELAVLLSGSLLVLVKVHESWVQLDVNAATGGWLGGGGAVTVTGCDTLPVAFWLSVTVSVAVKVPPAVWVCDGFWVVAAAVPSPNVQR